MSRPSAGVDYDTQIASDIVFAASLSVALLAAASLAFPLTGRLCHRDLGCDVTERRDDLEPAIRPLSVVLGATLLDSKVEAS